MFRGEPHKMQTVVLELGLKAFTQLDDAFVKQQCRTVFDNWRRLIGDAKEVMVMMWIGDGDEVFNWKGNLDDTFNWNDVIGF